MINIHIPEELPIGFKLILMMCFLAVFLYLRHIGKTNGEEIQRSVIKDAKRDSKTYEFLGNYYESEGYIGLWIFGSTLASIIVAIVIVITIIDFIGEMFATM